ncbi:transposase IS200-like protein [Bacteriovorax sp. DB6_IX]|nr:transposase IS200-like protein [Bacteriovorax sp. DB6_IX]
MRALNFLSRDFTYQVQYLSPMPRKQLIRTNEFPYHIISRVNNKEWFKVPIDEVWEYALSSFRRANELGPISFHAFVLMNNHYHLLVSTPNQDIDYFMRNFNKNLADSIRTRTKRENRVFGGRYTWSIVTNENYLGNVVRYVFQNPVRAKIVERVEDYPFSSLHCESFEKYFPLKVQSLFEYRNTELIESFNTSISEKESDLIRKGLRRGCFQVAKSSNTGRSHNLSAFLTRAS